MHRFCLTHHRYFLIATALWLTSVAAMAAPISFSASVGGSPTSATVDAFQADGQAYVSLEKLVRQLGGSLREAAGKATLDLGGRSAVITLNGTQVSTSTSSFKTQYPIKEADGGPYVAVADLESLFSAGFGVSVTRGASAPGDTEEAMDLLDEVAGVPAPEDAPLAEAPGEAAAPLAAADGEFLVILDPGHGGSDPGIVSGSGVNEKDIVFAVAQAVAKLLAEGAPCKVVLTRPDDRDLGLTERTSFANQSKAGLFISLHAGGSPSPAARGFEVFTDTGKSARAAGESQYYAEAAEKLLLSQTGAPSRGVRKAPMRVLSGLDMPALLIELGMLTTPAEESVLASADFQQKAAAAIAEVARQAAGRARGGQS